MKTVEYRGIRKLVGALLTEDTLETLSYGEVFPIAPVGKLLKSTESNSETKSYDNVPALVIDSIGPDTVTVDVAAIDLETLAKITGQYYDSTIGMLVEGSPTRPYMAIGYITEDTDGNEVYVWRNKGKFAIPSDEHNTKDTTTTSNGQQLVFTGIDTVHEFSSIPASRKKKTAKGISLETAKELTNYTESTFFSTVQDVDKAVTHKVTQ